MSAVMIGFSCDTDEMGKATPAARFWLTIVYCRDHLEKAAPYTQATRMRSCSDFRTTPMLHGSYTRKLGMDGSPEKATQGSV